MTEKRRNKKYLTDECECQKEEEEMKKRIPNGTVLYLANLTIL
jgi:hypothetical protein